MVRTEKPLMSLCAGDIMTRNVVMIPREMSLPGAARMLARAGVTGAPVVDGAGRCIGVLSSTDFMNWMKTEHAAIVQGQVFKPWEIPDCDPQFQGRVEDCMTRNPVLAFSNIKIGELASMMMDAHIHRIIVVDPANRPIGVVSTIDILAALARANRNQSDVENTMNDGVADETMH